MTDRLTKRFPSVTALDDLTLDIGTGVTGLVGSNGAGKSTLIKILLGLQPATSGSARVLDLDVVTHGPQIRGLVGYMPEHDCLPPDSSATEFVVHMGRMSGLPTTAARERTADTLRHVGLYEERYRPMGGYSTGMRQRVKLAQALVHDPSLILLDEPTNGLDVMSTRAVRDIIRGFRADGRCVLFSSHVMQEVSALCDTIIVIARGRVVASGTPDELRALTGHQNLEDAFVALSGLEQGASA